MHIYIVKLYSVIPIVVAGNYNVFLVFEVTL